MKTVILACLVAVAAAAPQFGFSRTPDSRFAAPRAQAITIPERVRFEPVRPVIQVLRYSSADSGDGNFNYEYEGENGIYKNVVGTPGFNGQSNMRGVFRFPLDDGTIVEVNFVADENGYRAESPIIPAMPAHALEQIRFAEEQRRLGVTYDQQGRRLTR